MTGAHLNHLWQWEAVQRETSRRIAEVYGISEHYLMAKIKPSDQMVVCTAAARAGYSDGLGDATRGYAEPEMQGAYHVGRHMAANGLGRPFQCTAHVYPDKVLYYVRSDVLQHGSVFALNGEKVERKVENALASGW